MRILVVLFFLMLMACADEPTLKFSEDSKSQADIENCNNKACPKISIVYPKAHDALVAEAINHKIDSTLAQLMSASTPESRPVKNLDTALLEFAKSYLQFETEFTKEHFVTFEADVNMSISFQNEQLLSFKTDFYLYTGGAHGYGGTQYLNLEVTTGEVLTNQDLISQISEFKKVAELAFREKYKISSGSEINSTGFWFEGNQFSLPERIGFTPNEIILIYNPYEIAPYAEGVIEIRLPIATVQPFLNTTFL